MYLCPNVGPIEELTYPLRDDASKKILVRDHVLMRQPKTKGEVVTLFVFNDDSESS